MPSLTTHHAPDSGTDGARTHDLPHVKRTLIPAELRFHPLAFGFLLAANKNHYIGQLPVMQALFLIFFQLFFRPFFPLTAEPVNRQIIAAITDDCQSITSPEALFSCGRTPPV